MYHIAKQEICLNKGKEMKNEELQRDTQERIRLNIGRGKDIKEGYLNCDYVKAPGVDLVIDISKERLPLPNDSVDEILCSHILEHIHDWHLNPMSEMHRVLKKGGILEIRVPYGLESLNEAFHVRVFLPGTMDAFIHGPADNSTALDGPNKKMFELIERRYMRVFWFGWHLSRYLRIHWLKGKRYSFPFGKKAEIIWILRKI